MTGVDIVEMRFGLDQPEHVVDGEYVVAVTAPGAVEFEPFLVGAEMGHNDISVELGIVPGDVPTSNRPARGPILRRLCVDAFRQLTDVETIWQWARREVIPPIAGCFHQCC